MYSEACKLLVYDHSAQAEMKVEEINNPVVRASLRESLRLYSAVVGDIGKRPGRVTAQSLLHLSSRPDPVFGLPYDPSAHLSVSAILDACKGVQALGRTGQAYGTCLLLPPPDEMLGKCP